MSHYPVNPAGQVVGTARNAFKTGITKKISWRLTQLKNFVKFLQQHEEEIVQSMYNDLRKQREEARLEIMIAVNHVNFLINNLKSWARPEYPTRRLIEVFFDVSIYHDPYGVVLVMGAWNVPLLTLVPVTGALAAGNSVVIKPSHVCPNFSKMLAKFLPKYLDPNLFPVFLGDIEATNLLLAQRFDYIYYTGSANVAKIVHLAANKYLTPTTLELGGKNPVYIDSSANLQLSAERVIWGKCFNSGQICIAPDYILCSKEVEKQFLQYAEEALEKFYGKDRKRTCPIVNDYHFQRISKLLPGLHIVIGGHLDALQNYIEPTIAIDVQLDHPIMQEEIFGPILPIITVTSKEEAGKIINDKEKPLALYIFSATTSVKNYFLENTSCGAVTMNDTLLHLIIEKLPFGGVGFSGMGCYKGKYSFDTFTHKKSVLVTSFSRIVDKVSRLKYPPYSKQKLDLVTFFLQYRGEPCWDWFVNVLVFLLGFAVAFIIHYFLFENKIW